jgi:hypothetical protein
MQEVKLIDTGVLELVGSDPDVGLKDAALELLLEEGNRVILDAGVVGVWDVADGEEEDVLPGVPLS